MSNITFKSGHVLDSKCNALVNTVNCVGVMGKGIALAFKQRYPKMYRSYRRDCDVGKVKIGELICYPSMTDSNQVIVNFPTKDHWRNNSSLLHIIKGLQYLIDHYEELGIESVAFPKLGCTNGGLDWSIVRSIMIEYLSRITIPIEIYE